MVSWQSIEKQLKRINFSDYGWGRSEARELPNIILPDEEIYECVNGYYEGGFALLVGTNVRVLLIDKKPLNYLTVEDLRFDMINEIDYSHRLFGARISISTGNKNLRFTSYNQARLRKLIGHVQHCMAEAKKKQSEHAEDQKAHLEQINQQLQAYLLAQHRYQQDLQDQMSTGEKVADDQDSEPEKPKPSPELSDYLFAQSLLAQHGNADSQRTIEQIRHMAEVPKQSEEVKALPAEAMPVMAQGSPNPDAQDLYSEGVKEIFGKQAEAATATAAPPVAAATIASSDGNYNLHLPNPLEINPLKIAYSKLPMALRNRKFGRPSFHAHSQAPQQQPHPAVR